jgi:hypothetical protein
MLLGGLFSLIGLGTFGWIIASHQSLSMGAFVGVFGLLFLGMGVYRFFLALTNLSNRALVFVDGLSVTQKGATSVMRWTEISAVWQNKHRVSHNYITIIDVHKYTIERQDGSKVVVDKTYDKIGELGLAIQQAVTRLKLPDAREALSRGESLPFGPVTISREALTFGKKVFPWSDTYDVSVWESQIRIRTSRATFGVTAFGPSVSSVPNVHLFFVLVNEILRAKQSAGSGPGTSGV